MRKLTLLACAAAMSVIALAESSNVHVGQGMSGSEAYSEVTFTCGAADGQNHPDLTAKANYSFTPAADNKLNISVSFENLEASQFIGLVDPCYCIIDGVGETALTLADGTYTATTDATFTEGATYTGKFKRMSSGAWYGGDLLFPFEFTYTAQGETPQPTAGNLWNKANPEYDYHYYGTDGGIRYDYTYDFSVNALKFELPTATDAKHLAQFYVKTGLKLVKDKDYKFEYDFTSNVALDPQVDLRCYISANFDEARITTTSTSVAAGETKHVSVEFTCPEDVTDLLVVIFLGPNPANTDVTLSNISLTEVGAENPDPGTDPDPVTSKNMWDDANLTEFYNYYTPGFDDFDFSNKQNITFDLPGKTTDNFDACFYLSTGLQLKEDERYMFEFDITSNVNLNPVISLNFEPKPGLQDQQMCVVKPKLKAGETQHVSTGWAYCPLNIQDLLVMFQLGPNPDQTKVSVTNISLVKYVAEPEKEPKELWPDATVTLAKTVFKPGWADSTDFTADYADNTLNVDLKAATGERWQSQFFLLTDLEMTADNTYNFSCDITSSESVNALVKLYQYELDGNFAFSNDVQLVAGETTHFEVKDITGKAINPVAVLFDFGGNPANTKITVNNFVLTENPDNGPVVPVEPATESFIFIASGTPESGEIVNVTPYTWWAAELSNGTEAYSNLNAAKTFTMTATGNDASSSGWEAGDFNFESVFAADYDLVFSIKSESAAKTAVKLDVNGGADEIPFEFTADGNWQTVRMNLKEKFPNVVKAKGTKGYVFSIVAGEGVKTGDTFTVTDVCWVPKGTDRPAYKAEGPVAPEVPEALYIVGSMEDANVAMTKNGNTFTGKVVFNEGTSSWFYFTTTASRAAATYYVAESADAFALDTPRTIVASEKAEPRFNVSYTGAAILTVDFDKMTVTVTKDDGNSIESIEAAADDNAVYFNLQGVRVDNPANGIFIRKAGNTVSKVLVK